MSRATHRSTRRSIESLLLVACLAAGGCDDPIQAGAGGPVTAPPPTAVQDAAATPPPAGDPNAPAEPPADAAPAALVYADEAFVEIDVQQRDPFRRFEIEVIAAPVVESIMSDTSVDEMRVLGIITGGLGGRAMIADRSGVGYTVRARQYIGRAETVQVGGSDGLAMPLVWRVDRIRANEVVLTRENPSAPDQPPLTRTLTLRSDEQMLLMSLGSVAPITGETETPVIPTIPSGG